MKGSLPERKWDVPRALILMHGVEQANRLLLADLDRVIVDRDSFNLNNPWAIGIAVSTTVQCALYCEYAIKTFHALLSDGSYRTGHLLAGRSSEEKGLYDHLEDRFMSAESANCGSLSDLIISQMRSREAHCPIEWSSDIIDVKATLRLGSANFEDWRYGYIEKGRLDGGVPKGLFSIAKGLELLTQRRLKNER